MKSKLTGMLLWFLVAGVAAPVAGEERPLKVFVLAGTSNMHGRSARIDDLPEDLRRTRQDILVHENGEWVPLEPGRNLVGNEATFGRAMTRHLGEPIGILRINVGKASDRPPGDRLRKLAQRSQEKGRPIVIAGMLLDVSFRDGKEEATAAAYRKNLTQWVNTTRKDLGNASLPIAMNRAIPPVARTPHLELVRQAQDSMKLPRFHVFDCDDVSRGNDDVHFNTAGRLEMGKRFAAAMTELMKAEAQHD